jgi:hypothetical protein
VAPSQAVASASRDRRASSLLYSSYCSVCHARRRVVGHHFNIDPDAPLSGQPSEYAIIAVYIAILTGLVMVGCLIGALLVAFWLRYAMGYTWAKVVRISLHAEYPAHWLRK